MEVFTWVLITFENEFKHCEKVARYFFLERVESYGSA